MTGVGPGAAQDQAAVLTVGGTCCFSNGAVTGLRGAPVRRGGGHLRRRFRRHGQAQVSVRHGLEGVDPPGGRSRGPNSPRTIESAVTRTSPRRMRAPHCCLSRRPSSESTVGGFLPPQPNSQMISIRCKLPRNAARTCNVRVFLTRSPQRGPTGTAGFVTHSGGSGNTESAVYRGFTAFVRGPLPPQHFYRLAGIE
jgi:hypothetical protein